MLEFVYVNVPAWGTYVRVAEGPTVTLRCLPSCPHCDGDGEMWAGPTRTTDPVPCPRLEEEAMAWG